MSSAVLQHRWSLIVVTWHSAFWLHLAAVRQCITLVLVSLAARYWLDTVSANSTADIRKQNHSWPREFTDRKLVIKDCRHCPTCTAFQRTIPAGVTMTFFIEYFSLCKCQNRLDSSFQRIQWIWRDLYNCLQRLVSNLYHWEYPRESTRTIYLLIPVYCIAYIITLFLIGLI